MAMLAPAVSVIIPCRNESKFIDQCLTSVFASDPVPGGFELLVVDGSSDDGTREKLAQWCQRQGNLHLLDNPDRIVPTAMNIGIRAARGEWIVRLDAHSKYPPDYLRLCIETSQRTSADNVGGLFITLPRNDSTEAQLVQALTTHRFGIGNADYRLRAVQEGPADTVPYGCFRRDVFDRFGWFDERLVRNQDYELNRRLSRGGGQIWRNPAIQVHYYNQESLRGLLRQALFTGQWNPWMWYLAPYSFKLRHAVPGLFALALLGATGLAAFTFLGIVALALIALPYTTLAIWSSLQQARHYKWWMFFILPFLFLAYHLTYGSGILWGLIMLSVNHSPVQRPSRVSRRSLSAE